MNFISIFMGIFGGVAYSLTTFAKKQDQPFDWEKFTITAIIGAITGLAMAIFDLPISDAYQAVMALGIVPLLQNIYQTTIRKIWPWIQSRTITPPSQ